ncbi:T-cell surface glycoprotein CD1e, membrane-associated precursor [Cavia porcellus]|uniref:T-cell surface glycoprotein CD1e, membrane-associated n=1 Tax=Cavia porcellus TaxID=10141 RepID=CD1E_CAVPO|nr:T-cell surface glycoprotein CD1e, membrane-associated precursor [Cavia porcellus]Q9QZY5.1 RecName: Full=T-cell surface glycoprotein CD1e, membrane-associated; Short=mCD1e; AltName: CD_antigen=CD1e; Contains: RecName: Full=T-cell surface glycoprotein CD1e, soluble; Short=sCD1e; Flags: Precursor [Cavia porcellus]AAF12745.1 CD1-E [Cavia porcellus]
MLLLILLFFKGLVCHEKSIVGPQPLGWHHPAEAEEPLIFRLLHIASFKNHSWSHSQASAWIGDLQTHGWNSTMGTIQFLKPWSQGDFSKEELKNFEALFRLYFHDFPREVHAFAHQFQFEYPFELQISGGCKNVGKTSENFLNGAYQGSDLLSFQRSSWEPSPGAGSRAQKVCEVLSYYKDITEIVQSLLSSVCPRFLSGLIAAGKSELERQVKPEVWLSRGPSPGRGRLQLVCHVSGFHPKPVWVMWMKGQQEQKGTKTGDIPNADETWYLQATLDVAEREATGLSCRVKHSSLGGHDIIIHWGGYSILLILMYVAVIVTLVTLIVMGSWHRKQSSNRNVLSSYISNPTFPLENDTQCPRSSALQLHSAQESWIKNRILKWKRSLNQFW